MCLGRQDVQLCEQERKHVQDGSPPPPAIQGDEVQRAKLGGSASSPRAWPRAGLTLAAVGGPPAAATTPLRMAQAAATFPVGHAFLP